MLKKIWNSPTITTWASYGTKALTMFAVLPLLLKNFSEGDIALWYLFFTIIISVSTISEFGFKQTFSRLVSYCYAGATDLDLATNNSSIKNKNIGPNINLLNTVVFGMNRIYLFLSVIFFIILSIFGSLSLVKPIKNSSNVTEAWISWIVILLVSSISFYGKIYVNFLEGLYKVALVKRVETLTSILSILTSFLVLLFFPSLLNLILVNQFWVIVNMIRDWYLCKRVEDGLYLRVVQPISIDKSVYLKIWSPAWRGGLGMVVSSIILNMNGIFVAQVSNVSAVASYLLALRVLNQIKDISMAPFYSKLPLIAMSRIENNTKTLINTCKKGMLISNLTFVFGFLLVSASSNFLLQQIKSETAFVDDKMWFLMGLAFFIQRIGGMHMQVYLSTNHVISHIADIVSGIIFLISLYFLFNTIGLYAIPLSMFIGYFTFYFWYASIHSYSSLKIKYGSFELYTLGYPIIMVLLYFIGKFVITQMLLQNLSG